MDMKQRKPRKRGPDNRPRKTNQRRKRTPVTLEELLANTVPEPNSGCLLWLGACNDRGYGQVARGAKRHYVHRLIFQLSNGVALSRQEHLMHSCDNPCCVNLDHLSIGDVHRNSVDMCIKGRCAKPGKYPRGVYKNTERGHFFTRMKWKGKMLTAGFYDTCEAAESAIMALREKMWRENYPELL